VKAQQEAKVSVGFRITSADLEALPDIPGIRYEIIDGELHVSHQPTLGHQHVGGKMYRALGDWSDGTGLGTPYMAPGLVFAEDQDVIPDLVWISHARQAEAEDASGHLRLAPELVIEILSPGRANEVRDR
jgi:Uma2 family endonuclease